MHFLYTSLLVVHHIRYVRHRGNDIHIKLTVQTFLHNFHVKQPQEPTTETEAQGQRWFRLESQRRIVQLQFLQWSAQVLIIFCFYRINPGKHHRFHFFKSVDGLVTRTVNMRNGIAHLHFSWSLDTRNDISYISRTEFFPRYHVHLQYPHFICHIFFPGIEELHFVTRTDNSVLHLKISDNSPERIEHRVKNQCLQRGIFISLRSRDPFYHGL